MNPPKINTPRIKSEKDLIDVVNEYGILQFWSEDTTSAYTLSGVNFNTLWNIREAVVNSKEIIYGKFLQKKATFVSKAVFPYLAAMRRDGYDFDSLSDEGLVSNRENLIMNAVGTSSVPSYALSKSLGIKGFDAAVTSLQHKTYICLQFKKSYMGTALLCRPEDVFGEEYVRSQYALSPQSCAQKIKELANIGLAHFTDTELAKILAPAV